MKDKIKLTFKSYFKYTFIFTGDDGETYQAGGDASDIYRFGVDKDNIATLNKEGEWEFEGLSLTKIS